MRVTIERLGLQGDGIAQGPVFAARCLPGEVVEGDLDGQRINAPRIISPSAERVRPGCAHFRSCGGCSLQHASDTFVARWKRGVVETALAAQGIETEEAEVVTSPPSTRRRAVLSGRRTKSGALLGFHAPRSESIASIPGCQVLSPEIKAGFAALETLVRAGASRKSEIRLHVTTTENGLDVLVSDGKPLDRELRESLSHHAVSHGFSRLVWNGEQLALIAPPAQQFGAAKVSPPPGSFLQATKEGEEALVSAVRDGVGAAGRIVDLFAGCGTFSLPLAQSALVHAVESSRAMLVALDHGWRNATGLRKVTTETRDLFRQPLMPDELNRFDAVVIDPPRAGAEAQMREIAESDIARVVSVSCNPVTFARDARALIDAGFSMETPCVVDQFRWSTHVELVAVFLR